jgi:colanic acid/amylovoran biosynthesis protein
MKITLIHCYSDHNRGDTGIIYSIHDLIKDIAPASDIRAMSVFSEKDSRLLTDHKHTSQVIDTVYPAFFPEPGICLNETSITKNKTIGKIFTFIKYAFINTVIYLTKSKTLAKIMLSDAEYSSFENFISSDIVISKGGSFLYSFKGWNGALFFFRMISPFYLANRFGVKTYIYSQSLGPFENKSSKLLFKSIQNSINKIYLREKNCLRYLEKSGDNISIISDSAFALNAHTNKVKTQNGLLKKVAITARPHNFADKQQESIYIEALSNLVNTLITENYQIFLVAQVTGPSEGEDDRKSLDILYHRATQKDKITYIRENLNPRELKALYGEMDFLIGTRLHSVIFALGMGVPCINIAYHGTKAQGIMGRLELNQYVLNIESMTSQSLLLSFRELESNTIQYKSLISNGLAKIKAELKTSMSEILKP